MRSNKFASRFIAESLAMYGQRTKTDFLAPCRMKKLRVARDVNGSQCARADIGSAFPIARRRFRRRTPGRSAKTNCWFVTRDRDSAEDVPPWTLEQHLLESAGTRLQRDAQPTRYRTQFVCCG